MPIKYSEIYDYWNRNPCSGGNKDFPFNYFRYCKVLEIGCGAGVDAKRFVDAGSYYTGIDLTDKAVELTKRRIGDRGKVLKMNAEYIDFPDNHFDLVYSFGVIHHAVSPENIIREIYRVLKPNGQVCIMLYNKYSFKYLIEIMLLRKILWHIHYHKYNNIRKDIPNPTHEQWLSINTDNLGCPLSRVYTKEGVERLLYQFYRIKTFTKNKGWFRIVTGIK